ncbi:YcxB family protein [Psychromonas hadalis]|uniref:YcxB family protein n=1 Tax=Psychromonas hadalis TaxID=211669 RepID=UPI0003B4DD57|nr:YcxB family protein [Psychromonas hadalis]
MQFTSYFILNREHFSECFDQSALLLAPKKPRYKFMGALLLFGFYIMITTNLSVAVGLFFIGLAFVEFFSFKYRKAWWLTRQMWSKNSGNKINLSIDENAIKIESLYQTETLSWDKIKNIVETPTGVMLNLENGSQSYLSKSCLNEQVIDFIKSKLRKHD